MLTATERGKDWVLLVTNVEIYKIELIFYRKVYSGRYPVLAVT